MSRSASHPDWHRRRRRSSLLAGDALCFWRHLRKEKNKSSRQFGGEIKASRSACRAFPPRASCRRVCFVFSTSLLFRSSSASPSPPPVCRNRYKLSGVCRCRISKPSWKSGASCFTELLLLLLSVCVLVKQNGKPHRPLWPTLSFINFCAESKAAKHTRGPGWK